MLTIPVHYICNIPQIFFDTNLKLSKIHTHNFSYKRLKKMCTFFLYSFASIFHIIRIIFLLSTKRHLFN